MPAASPLELPATQYLGAGNASTHNEEYRQRLRKLRKFAARDRKARLGEVAEPAPFAKYA
jgi:hypothetical protein